MPDFPENWTTFLPNPSYEISDYGNVRRKEETQTRRALNFTMSKKVGGTLLLRKEKKKARETKRPKHPPGIYVSVVAPGIMKKNNEYRIADQVLLHFVPNPDNCRAFRYKDGDHRNTHWGNLEWVPDDQIPVELLSDKPRPTTRHETATRTVFICVFPQQSPRAVLDAALSTIYRKENK